MERQYVAWYTGFGFLAAIAGILGTIIIVGTIWEWLPDTNWIRMPITVVITGIVLSPSFLLDRHLRSQ